MSNTHSTRSTRKAVVPVGDGEDIDAGELTERELTEKQDAFVSAFVAGPTATLTRESAVSAGYSEKSAHQIGCGLLKLPHIVAAIDARLRDAITSRLTVQAVKVVGDILANPDASLKLKGDIAIKVIEHSGLVQRAQAEKAKQTGINSGKKLGELTRAELEEVVRQGASVLQAAAVLPAGQTIEGTHSAQNSAQRKALPSQ